MATDANWPEVKLESVADEITVGYVGPMAEEYRSTGVPFFRSLNIKPLRVERNDLKFISPEFHKCISKSRLRPGDVVIVRTGDPGTAAVIPDSFEDANCADLVVVRPSARLNSHFLAYYVNAVAHHQVAAHVVGAVQQHFNVGSAKQLLLRLPERREQDEIAETLRQFDRKLELNRRMNRTLEDLAAALFRSWFVDFDPVVAKAAGRPPAHLRPDLAALFPAHWQESKLGAIPHGWSAESIYKAADVIYGAPFASGKFNTAGIGKPLIRIRDLPDDEASVFTPEEHPKGTLVHPGDIVVGMDGEFRAYLWGGEESWLNQRLCMFVPKKGFSTPFVRCAIAAPLAEVEATELATTVIHLGKQDIDRFQFVCPPPEILKPFNEIAQPWYDQIVHNRRESRTLAALRDTLLPKLLSGELRVKSAEKLVEAQV